MSTLKPPNPSKHLRTDIQNQQLLNEEVSVKQVPLFSYNPTIKKSSKMLTKFLNENIA